MRMHLQGLAEIQQAMAVGDLDAAARIASMKLGMSSMPGDQARQEARHMPPGMRELGARLHRQAGEFAVVAQDAAATGDVRKAQAVLGQMMQTCVACHAAYRLK
jgi:mono/diheme cytochrome c family protein